MQNKSHAVMSQRFESINSLYDFPTPPWATRSLFKYVLNKDKLINQKCMEPACGRGFMAEVLKEYFLKVDASDIHDYGYGEVKNFLATGEIKTDWIITNPPFNLAEEFVINALSQARSGVAILVRTVFLEGIGRHKRLFSLFPPTILAQFAERVPIVKGRVDSKVSSATSYAWFVWKKPTIKSETKVLWIPPCRKELEKEEDYNGL